MLKMIVPAVIKYCLLKSEKHFSDYVVWFFIISGFLCLIFAGYFFFNVQREYVGELLIVSSVFLAVGIFTKAATSCVAARRKRKILSSNFLQDISEILPIIKPFLPMILSSLIGYVAMQLMRRHKKSE